LAVVHFLEGVGYRPTPWSNKTGSGRILATKPLLFEQISTTERKLPGITKKTDLRDLL
jgi:hypothetical protein